MSVAPPISAIETADRPREKTEREGAEGEKLLRRVARLRKELLADVAGKIAVDRKIKPLEDIADQSRQCGAQRRLYGNWQRILIVYVCHRPPG
jgi:hypothetical protein